MNSSTEAGLTTARLQAIDWTRGLAVLLMILAHTLDAWTWPADRMSLTYRYGKLLGGFAAPLFLWLSGASLALAAESTLQRTGSLTAARRRLIRRGLELFILAFAFRLHAFVFNPGGPLIAIFRVDILNVLGISVVAAAWLWGMAGSHVWRLASLLAASAAVAILTPIAPGAPWVDRLPIWLQWHVRAAGEHTVFTVFPWMGFVFAGAAAGILLGTDRVARTSAAVPRALVAGGLAVLLLGLYTGTLPTPFGAVGYWTSSPAFFAVRVGLIMLILSGLSALEYRRAGVRAPGALRLLSRFGQASLLVYWIHVQLVYGWATQPLHQNLSIYQVMLAYILFTGLMYAVIPARDRLRALWTARRSQLEPETTAALTV